MKANSLKIGQRFTLKGETEIFTVKGFQDDQFVETGKGLISIKDEVKLLKD